MSGPRPAPHGTAPPRARHPHHPPVASWIFWNASANDRTLSCDTFWVRTLLKPMDQAPRAALRDAVAVAWGRMMSVGSAMTGEDL
jgi:hypothetical protein